MSTGRLTIFTSERPAVLGKTFKLSPDGVLTKETAGQMSRGRYSVAEFADVEGLAALLQTIRTDQAISASLPNSGEASGVVVAEKLLDQTPGAVSRSKRCFVLSDAPGVMILDYDPPEASTPQSREELWRAVLGVAPLLADAGVVHWYSGSSLIFNGDQCLKPAAGQRLYVMTQSLADMPRALAVLNKRLWLAGIGGHVKVSASGSLLVRNLFDAAMGDAGARLDFAPAGSICTPPLEQRRGTPTFIASGSFVDTRVALPDLSSDEEARYAGLVEQAKHRAQPEADAARARWREEHTREAVARAVADGADDLEQIRALVGRTLDAAVGGVLLGTFPLIHVDDRGCEHSLTVDQLLSDRERYHLSKLLSPLNPDHRERTPDTIAYLLQPSPVLFDLDEGGKLYRLAPQAVRLQVTTGGRAELAGQIADQLATCPDVLSLGGSLVLAQLGRFAPMSKPLLSYLIGTRVALYRQGKDRASAVDVDQQTADMAHALLSHRARTICGRTTLPLIDSTGRVIDRPGLDEASGIYLDLKPGEWPTVPQSPTRAQAVDALRRLFAPWRAYKWASANDRAAMLATVLTVPLRPTIDAAPGLFADAPIQASGKSKAVGAVAALVEGGKVPPKPWVSGSEPEVEKFALSVARSGVGSVVLDNVLGLFDSACLAAAMTEGRVSGRLLGANETLSPSARLLWLASGNNASLSRDMATRWLRARIDSGSGSPHRLAYAFDPVEAALADRVGIVSAILTVHRAWHAAGCPRGDQISTRFAEWGRTVRHLTLWLRDSGIADDAGIRSLGDPAHSILSDEALVDPEQESLGILLCGLVERFGSDPFSPADVVKVCKEVESGTAIDVDRIAVSEGIYGLMPRARGGLTSQAVAACLRNRRDRPAFGLKLLEHPQYGRDAARGSLWRVQRG